MLGKAGDVFTAVVIWIASVQAQYNPDCHGVSDGATMPHPSNCDQFLVCLHGAAIVQQCGLSQHFSPSKGVCDFPQSAGCTSNIGKASVKPVMQQNLLIPPHLQGPYDLQSVPQGPLPAPHPRPQPGRDQSDRLTYQETVYGVPPGAGAYSSFPLTEMRSYASVVMNDAKIVVHERMRMESHRMQRMSDVIDSGPYRYVSNFMNAKPYAKVLAKCAMAMLESMKLMQSRFHVSGAQVYETMQKMSLEGSFLKTLPGTYSPDIRFPIPPDVNYCPYPKAFTCDTRYKYRSLDGSCNNLNDPIIGRSMTPFARLLPAYYQDGIESIRYSVTGGPLPGARHISKNLFPDFDRPSQETTMMFVFFGQFVDHDLTRTAITEVLSNPDEGPVGDTMPVKCGYDGCQTDLPGLESCMPIPIPQDDSDFAYNRCIKFVRSVEVPALSCQMGPREQLNQPTHWLDGSMIYGDSKEVADKLRDLSDPGRGPLAVNPHPYNSYHRYLKPLPPIDSFVSLCRDVNLTVQCFKGGDERINENVGLGMIHTVWIREHNRIEDELHRLNPHWDGERLYQESRKIIVASLQHIFFNEHLPLILGPELMRKLDLGLRPDGYNYAYDNKLDARIPNAFAAAAFRFGHTLLQERVERADAYQQVDKSLFLSNTFHRPAEIYNDAAGGVDALIRGLAQEPSQTFDHFFTKQITKSLFTEKPPFGPGMDLLSLNIQRARDHGLPGYTAYRDWCGFGRAHNFKDLAVHIKDPRALEALVNNYRHVDDIDLFAGGVSETSLPNAVVGPTFGCIIGATFSALKHGDRFWYENHNDVGFTPGQLQQIRRMTFARILCVNGDNVHSIQPWVFLKPHPGPGTNQLSVKNLQIVNSLSKLLGIHCCYICPFTKPCSI